MNAPFVSGAPGTGSFAYFDAPASQLIKTGAGSLRIVSIGTPAVNGIVKLYDGLDDTGTLIGNLDATVGRDFDFSCQFNVGLFVVVSGSPNVTVVYY